MLAADCCILNAGPGAWAFAEVADWLRDALGIDIADQPRRFNYLLQYENPTDCGELFIPLAGIEAAADKRSLAHLFREHDVPIPDSHLFAIWPEVLAFLAQQPERSWCLKYPTGCGAAGHRLLTPDLPAPRGWPVPYLVQEFIHLGRPEVYRLYGAGGDLFGWVARRFPTDVVPSPWVAHARGARYEPAGEPPAPAVTAARQALVATGLLDSFGCVDLLRRPDGTWLVLEVGTDGLYNHVDREVGEPALDCELRERLAAAFWRGGSSQSLSRKSAPAWRTLEARRGSAGS